jgi:predicted P-loop ATPase
MLGMVAQWLQINNNSNDLEHGHSLAPILISTEQGWGKSTFCEMLLPKELRDYYTDSFNILLPNACEHKMAKNGLINMDEYDSISKSKQAALKTLMQKSTLKYKIGNSKAFTQVKRLASFIGTTNRRDVMVDPTGSRRFLCVELEHPIDVQTPLDYAQLYAQLKQELLEGRQHWLTDAQEDAIQEDNLQFKRVSAAEQLFFETFRFAEPHAEGAISLNAPQIFTILQKENPAALRGTTPNAFYSLMASWKRCYHTHAGNRYWVERLPKA